MRVREGEAEFGLEHVSVHCGVETARSGRKPAPAMRQERGRRADLMAGVRRNMPTPEVPLRVKVQGEISETSMALLLEGLQAYDWAFMPLSQPVSVDGLPGLKVSAMRALRAEWIDVDSRVGWVTREGLSILQNAIDDKSTKLPSYKLNAGTDVRLLVVANHLWADGKVDVTSGVKVNTQGFTRVYFKAYPRYVIEYAADGQMLQCTPWIEGQLDPGRAWPSASPE